ncbi:ABC transporter permease [Bacillus sp. FJAT-49736]|uniref:ABC transporter permease n=1 Tax=Bacillus sp. FJAT-49736 TaxID=2833582 RepID=UPI001BC9AA6D|nr:ABC transporter permease [Bacillus sp. FJAT-49736]MBS4172978.1 ABC transporter permease [Bacillus sp. FJAT-49736]
MRKALSVCFFEIKRTLSKPSAFILMLALPIIFTLIFGSVFGNSSSQAFTLAIVDKDKSHVSAVLINRLKQDQTLKVKRNDAKKSAELLKAHNIDGIVTIQKGFQEELATTQNPNVVFQYQPGSPSNTIIKQSLNQEIKRIKLQEMSAIEWGKASNNNWLAMFDTISSSERRTNELTKIVTLNDSAKSLSGVSYSSAGFSIMFVMIMMMSVTGVIIEAKNTGVWSRLLTTSITKFQLLFGYLLAFFLIGWIQFGILMTFSSIVFHVEWGNILGLAALVSSLLLCVVGLGLAIASIVKTTEQQTAIGSLIIVSTCMLGGVYWPLNIVPDIMQKIANFVPQSWAMKGFTSLIVEGGALPDILTPISILLIFAVAFLSFGLSRVRVS